MGERKRRRPHFPRLLTDSLGGPFIVYLIVFRYHKISSIITQKGGCGDAYPVRRSEVFNKAEGYTKEDIAFIGFPSLTAAVIAALTPSEDVFSVTDEAIRPFSEPIDFARHRDADLVAISLNMTYKAKRAAALADRFRDLGKKVVFGGVHVTSLLRFSSREV